MHFPCLGSSAVSGCGCSSVVGNTVVRFLNCEHLFLFSWWKIGRPEFSSVACASVVPPEDGSRPSSRNVFLFLYSEYQMDKFHTAHVVAI